ncbi:DinB family protein [Oceanobacillus jeddahense]|uniref:DinB family protein n=1 Tax=Oceanobacillus jeddahense TaxID=1462527 RepID=A0ABY5K416_9BACI|nr:DinB family protein [Oceanobacillus jeddahense]UUI05454.1 DinB family protein [Oceanobacillus jeddahense]
MLKLFQYNWQVRDDWFTWCESISEEELVKRRIGGLGSILHNMFHIIDVEYMWMSALQGLSVPEEPSFENYANLAKLKGFSKQSQRRIEPFLVSWTSDMESQILSEADFTREPVSPREKGYRQCVTSSKHGEIIRHVLVHEIHHIGQLSVWARELGREPVSANLRGLNHKYLIQ